MLQMNLADITPQLNELEKRSTKLNPPPVLFYKYLKRVLEEDTIEFSTEYPRTIRIPKDNKYLLKGDFEPAQEIVIEKPITLDEDKGGSPIWFCDPSKKAYLRFGYENLDARKLSKIELSSTFIHMFLGGASGHGKSVTMNSMLGALFHEYAPWDLEVHLSDAKIVEFKKYGTRHRIPHIGSIAATEDADFVISVLERIDKQMNERQSIFERAGVSNLSELRRKTGLAIPRVVTAMDEVESTFRLAGRRAERIAQLIDNQARLGRSAGYHIIMATQNLSADIPKSALGQIRIRTCLGATEKVSKDVLDNNGAKDNYGKIGRLIVNTEVLSGGDTSLHNIKFQTPYITDDEFEGEMEFLERKAKELGYHRRMAFYDENEIFTVERFDTIIDKSFERMRAAKEMEGRSPIILGYPAFVTDDDDDLYKIYLDGKDVENILITSTSSDRVAAHLHNITKSLHNCGYSILCYTSDLSMQEWLYNPTQVVEARNAEQPPLSNIGSLVRKRLFLLQVETSAKGATYSREKVEEQFKAAGIPSEHWGNDLLARRYVAFSTLIKTKDWEDVKPLLPSFLNVYNEYVRCKCPISALTADKFSKAVFVVGDISKIVGYGRDTREKYLNYLKKAMQDSSRVGVLFVLFTRSMEGVTSLVSGLRYTIFDSPDSKEWGRARAEEPRELKPVLALLFDSVDSANPQRKFKRTLLREEN